MAGNDVIGKAELYHTLYELNAAFAQAALHCRTLQQSGLFKSKAAKLFPSFIQELQAEMNFEFLNPLHDAEMADWTRHSKARKKWERYLKGPNRKQRKR
jgi:hypothetical protein